MDRFFKKLLLVVLVVISVTTTNSSVLQAASIAGKTEANAIELKIGKKKTSKFWTGSNASIYYVVATPSQGRLSIDVDAKKLGTSATIQIHKTGVESFSETQVIKYNKNKKVTKGTMTSEYILPVGNYIVQITPGKIIKSSKSINVTAKFKAVDFDDIEPNNVEENAQTIQISEKAKTYNMFLTTWNIYDENDVMDCMKFDLKKDAKLNLSLSSKVYMDNVKVLIRQKNETGYITLKSYDMVGGKLSEQVELEKGTYCIKVWCTDATNKIQMPYTLKIFAK
ncbi:MAG: hypothetical protein ACI4EE_07755 [Lachnospiraceae bacterium]